MKVIAKKNRELALINAQNTQNENRAETITLVVPEEYEDYNKKVVFITDDGIVWDIIQDNTYKLTKAITKYKQVDFYIWLTKEVDGESIDFRTKTKTLNFYHNVDASDEITDEEIHGVNTVVNLLEEQIEKVENLNIEATKIGDTTTVTITKKDGTTESVEINDGVDGTDGEDGYTPQKGIDYFTEQDIEEIEGDILNEVYTKPQTDTLLEEKADVEDIPDVSNFITKDVNNLTNYTLKTNTGSLIDLEINNTTYIVTLKLKNQDGTVISTKAIDLPLETVVVGGDYDKTTKEVILSLEGGSEVRFSVADLVSGLQSEITSTNKLASDLVDDTNSGNKFVTTTEKQTWNNKLDESDLTDYVKDTDYAQGDKGGTIKKGNYLNITNSGKVFAEVLSYELYSRNDVGNNVFIGKGTLENVIAGKQLINQTQLDESQETQDEEIEKLQTENARLKATLPTTTGEGQDVTLDKTAEFEFIKPPLPMGNTKQDTTTGKNLLNTSNANTTTVNGVTSYRSNGFYYLSGTNTKTDATWVLPNTQNTNLPTFEIGQTYTMSFKGTLPSGIYAQLNGFKTSTGTQYSIGSVMRTVPYITFTIDSDYSSTAQLFVGIQGATTNADCNFAIQIEKGSTATSYEPYTNGASPNPDYPQEITNVTGDVEVKVQNKNLFNIKNYSKTGWNITIDNPLKGLSAGNYTLSTVNKYITANKGMTIYFSDIVNGSMNDKIGEVFVSYEFGNTQMSNTKSITQEQINAKYLIIGPQDILCTQEVLENMKITIEKGSTKSSYTPHQEQVLPLTLGNIELCKIGDYQDYFYKESNKWYLHKEIGKTTLTGTEYWNINTSYNYNVFICNLSGYARILNQKIVCSNYYNGVANTEGVAVFGTNYNNSIGVRTVNDANNNLYISNNDITSVNDFKTWLSTHNTIVYYVLATPTDTEIADTTLISQLEAINNAISYEEQTNISGTSDGSNPIFSVEAYQSTKLILEENNAKYESLEARVALLE